MVTKRSRNFIYANSSIRVDGVPDSHKNWYPNALTLWNNHINWDQAKSYISAKCHGTTAGAKIIETTLNTLDKYTGNNAKTSVQKNDLAYGITQDLVNSLNQLSMGSTTAKSLLNYLVTGEGTSTAINAGFSFESRLSEFIQRLANQYANDPKALRTGSDSVYAGESTLLYLDTNHSISKEERSKLLKKVLADAGRDLSDLTSYIYEEIQQEINGKLELNIAVVAYKVPQKSDIIASNYMSIQSSYGPLVSNFLQIISNARLSLKNTQQPQIKLGSTNDNTRLRSFISQFASGIEKKFSTICTFIFSSKKSNNTTVSRYLDWARIVYELIGAGQSTNRNTSEDLLVDYLIVNNYNAQGIEGKARVFNVKDLLLNLPTNDYAPFVLHDEQGKYHEGPVELNLKKVVNFSFS